MTQSETTLQRHIQLALSAAGCTVWRNETAQAWLGRNVGANRRGEVRLTGARQIRCGLCVGSSDLVGIAPDGRFLAVEVKRPQGRVTAEQRRFVDAVIAAGGIAGIARSVDEALALLHNTTTP